MKKRIFGLLCTIAAVLLLGTLAGAAEPEHKHCICGDLSCDGNGSDFDHGIQEFKEWPEEILDKMSGSYYLTKDVTVNRTIYVNGPVSMTPLNVCLCGYTLTCDNPNGPGIVMTGLWNSIIAFNLTDCHAQPGTLTFTNNQTTSISVGTESNCFRLYNGHITTPADHVFTFTPSTWVDLIHGSVTAKSSIATSTTGTTGAGTIYLKTTWYDVDSGKPLANSDEAKSAKAVENLLHTHCLCGDTACDGTPENTTDYHKPVRFKEWTATDSLPGSTGNYYLTGDVTLSDTWNPSGTSALCLHGHTVSITGEESGIGKAAVYIANGTGLSITDCQTTPGTISAQGNTISLEAGYDTVSRTVSLYNGTVKSSGGYALAYQDNSGSNFINTSVNLYGGALEGNSAAVSMYLYTVGILNYIVPNNWYGTYDGKTYQVGTTTEQGDLHTYSTRIWHHSHTWTYTATDKTVTASCVTGCPYNGGDTEITLTMPALSEEYGAGSAEASFTGANDSTTFVGNPFPALSYTDADGKQLNAAPTAAGNYKVVFTLGGKEYEYPYTIGEHQHSWTYTVNGTTITASCVTGCPYNGGDLSVTLLPPTQTLAGGSGSPAAAYSAQTLAGQPFAHPIRYYSADGSIDYGTTPPTAAGNYTAVSVIDQTPRLHLSYTIGAHQHSWTYTVNGTTITAVCRNALCTIPANDESLSLSLLLPELKNEDDFGDAFAKLDGTTIAGQTVTVTYIYEDATGNRSDIPPKTAGTYKVIATVFLDGQEIGQITREYVIAERIPTYYRITLQNEFGTAATLYTDAYGRITSLPTPKSPDPWHIFQGWYDGAEDRITAGTYLTGDITLTARWSLQKTVVIPDWNTLSFRTGRGDKLPQTVFPAGSTVDLAPYIPTRAGYTFTGWFLDQAMTKPVTQVTLTKNTAVYAGWEKIAE